MPIMSREKVMDKIRKLVALSGSSNIHEAAAAAAGAQRLMFEHKIAESEITFANTEDIVIDMETYRDLQLATPPRWHGILLNAVAHSNFCTVIEDGEIVSGVPKSYRRFTIKRTYLIIGTAEDRLAVKYLYEMLRSEIERLCHYSAASLRFDRADRASFKLGAACTIAGRLRAEARNMREQTRQSAPYAITLIDKTERAVETFVRHNFRKLRSTKGKLDCSRGNSFQMGCEAAKDVSIGHSGRALSTDLKGLPAGTASL